MSEENTKLAKIFISGTRRFGNSRERNYLKSSTCTKVFSEQLLISKKSDGKSGPAINLKNKIKANLFPKSFQNGRSSLPEIHSRTRRFAIQDRS